MEASYGAAEFKARCLKIIEEVAKTGQEVRVTKRGKPMVRLVRDLPREAHAVHAHGRVAFKKALAIPGLTVVPISPEIAADSYALPGAFYGDPAHHRFLPGGKPLLNNP